jgi:hypothetical protein
MGGSQATPGPSEGPFITRAESNQRDRDVRLPGSFCRSLHFQQRSRNPSAGRITVRGHELGQARSPVVTTTTPSPNPFSFQRSTACVSHSGTDTAKAASDPRVGRRAKENYCCKRFEVGIGLDQERNSKLSIVCGHSRKAS